MGAFEIIGGKKLKGEITPQGAKNEALQVINAVLLTDKEVIINNIPDIIDVNKLIDLLKTLGVKINKLSKGSYSFIADEVDVDIMTSDEFKRKGASLRGSIMVVGPLLARFGKGYIPKPGCDKIGRRRLDTHFLGFQNLCAEFDYDKNTNFYKAHSPNGLKGTFMLAKEQISNEKMKAMIELKNEIADISIQMAEKIIKLELKDVKSQKKLIEQTLKNQMN